MEIEATMKKAFLSSVSEANENGCKLWMRSKGGPYPYNYGQFYWNGKRYAAHRLSWEIENGPIPEGLCVLHKCDIGACVNPEHLFLGTKADNTADMFRKNRANHAIGERVNTAKLTEQQVREIFWLHHLSGYSIRELAKMYPVAKTNVGVIVAGQGWKHLKLKERWNKLGNRVNVSQ